eukprot:338787-Pleurochrysis_carterae.AAC.3
MRTLIPSTCTQARTTINVFTYVWVCWRTRVHVHVCSRVSMWAGELQRPRACTIVAGHARLRRLLSAVSQ